MKIELGIFCRQMYMFIITRGVRGAFLMSMICRYGEIVFRVGILSILPENDEVL